MIANLEHRHSYVRKNAVLALAAIYRLPKGELLVPDAPDLVERLLKNEQDLSTRRNAFLMLANHAQDKASVLAWCLLCLAPLALSSAVQKPCWVAHQALLLSRLTTGPRRTLPLLLRRRWCT